MRLLMCMIVLLAPIEPALAQAYKPFKDWVGACDNTRYCTAIGFSADVNESTAQMHFERGGAPTEAITRITLRFDQTPVAGKAQIVAGSFVLRLEAKHLHALEDGVAPEVRIEDAAQIAGLLDAMLHASELELRVDHSRVAAVSLAGSSAVMLWLDEQQQRLGTDSALVRRGTGKASAIVPPAPRVVMQMSDARALDEAAMLAITLPLRASLEADSCEETDPDIGSRDAAWRIDAEQTLIQLMCFRGAYNFGSKWYVQRGALAPQPLLLPLPNFDGSGRMEPEEDLINAEFFPDTGELIQFSKGRGIGDCGNEASWLWDGKRFQLRSYKVMGDCRGVAADLWPVLWRSRQ